LKASHGFSYRARLAVSANCCTKPKITSHEFLKIHFLEENFAYSRRHVGNIIIFLVCHSDRTAFVIIYRTS
jgi:hypothetical protein